MTSLSASERLGNAERERAVLVAAGLVAVILGILAASGSPEWLAWLTALLVIAVVAWTFPLAWSALILIALIPSQFYLNVPETSLTLRGAVLFAGALALRVAPRAHWRSQRAWMVPAALFLGAALVGAWGAASRYAAFKGIFDWAVIFVTTFVVVNAADLPLVRRWALPLLMAGAIAQAALGLAQYIGGVDNVLAALRTPIASLFFQPDLLQERLSGLSFNWITPGRALPFGTFINAIDYALFLAAVLPLPLTLLLNYPSFARPRDGARTLLLAGIALLLIMVTLLTLKASGVLALVGGVLCLTFLSMRHVSARTLFMAVLVILAVLVLILLLSDVVAQRVLYLVQREQGGTGTLGRLEIWANLLPWVSQRPWFGYGLNNAVSLAEPNRTLVGGAFAFATTTPESAYVAALLETGLLGFLALLGWFGAALYRGYRAARQTPVSAMAIGATAGIVALLMGNLTVASFTTDQNGMLLGAFVGLVFAVWNPPSKNLL